MLFAFMAYKQQFMERVTNLIEKLIEFKMLSLHFERIADIALTSKEELHSGLTNKHKIKGKIELKNICFRYSEASPNILEDINLKVEAGESIAITGPSGAGKSTLLKIMLRLNTPQAGEVCIDDIPLNKLGSQQYRDQIAAVMQNDELLSGSIADNIAFFDQRIDMERVYKCAKLAFIDADINNMPMSYNSLIGDMGSSLSGGQKQRVLLARALYKKPRILFMDEATSHLDSSLESDINRAIKALDITRVIIAHRKETIESADKIVKVL
ncbi:peptidase domain-containing ABC transporter [Pseudoalteromonas sp. 0303]|uniref:peptidase domain-containing ABC transporter n=1 Tax=Pseudoalteromonas TaxID=53246 RepID=UPI003857BF62